MKAARRAAALLSVVVLAGCGIPVDDHPRDADVPGGSLQTLEPHGSDEGSAVERLCFVRDSRLVRVSRPARAQVPLEEQMRSLLGGPNGEEAVRGLTSTLPGTTSTIDVVLTDGRAVVEIGARSDDGVRTDETLAFGQIVCTLSSRTEIGTITFTSGGRPLGVPREDGSLTSGPLTVADYAKLIGP